MIDIKNFCDRNFVTHNKNQNATSNVFDIHVKISNVGLEIRYDQLKNKSSWRVTYGNPCYSIDSKA
jgi:hypothetical protein